MKFKLGVCLHIKQETGDIHVLAVSTYGENIQSLLNTIKHYDVFLQRVNSDKRGDSMKLSAESNWHNGQVTVMVDW